MSNVKNRDDRNNSVASIKGREFLVFHALARRKIAEASGSLRADGKAPRDGPEVAMILVYAGQISDC